MKAYLKFVKRHCHQFYIIDVVDQAIDVWELFTEGGAILFKMSWKTLQLVVCSLLYPLLAILVGPVIYVVSPKYRDMVDRGNKFADSKKKD